MLELPNLCLIALAFFYGLNLFPMIFESFTSDRIWASNPPESFYMFRGPYGQKTTHYWRVVSPLALLSFIVGLILNWHVTDRKSWLLVAFLLYLVVQVCTMAYFVPEQEGLISNAGALPRDVLKVRTNRWIFLNYVRNVTGMLAYIFLQFAILVPTGDKVPF